MFLNERPKPPPRPGSFEEIRGAAETEPRFKALLGASMGEERRELAKAIPVAPPYPYLSELENEVLKLIYLGGGAYTKVGRQYGLSANKAKQMARGALYYVAFYEKHPERADERIPKGVGPEFQQFMMAESLEEKRFTAKRHPELKVVLEKLTDREAQVIQATLLGRSNPGGSGRALRRVPRAGEADCQQGLAETQVSRRLGAAKA